MRYQNFTNLHDVKKRFGINNKVTPLFRPIPTSISPSAWLKQSLTIANKHLIKSEKARSEFIVMPILLDICEQNKNWTTIYSGERFTVDKTNGLSGECDFILSKNKDAFEVSTPILSMVEAKRHDLEQAIPQCAAQMIAAQIYNKEREKDYTRPVYGCVTTAELWRFLKLEDKQLFIDKPTYHLSQLETILGIFQYIIDEYREHDEKVSSC